MLTKTRKQGNSIMLTVPKEFDVPNGVEVEAKLVENGILYEFVEPKKEFFDAVFSKLQIPVSKALVIGDSLTSDIIGGIQYDIDTCWFNPNGSDNTMSQTPTYEIKQLSELLSIL